MKRQKPCHRPGFVFVDRAAFYLERRTAGLTRKEAAHYLGVTVRTLRNWENGTNRIPYPAFKLIRMRAGGIVQAPGWDGWRFGRDGALFSPDGRSFLPWQLQQLRLVFSMAEHFRQQLAGWREGVGASATAPPPPRLCVVGGAS
jgi:DNA-binding XRE family transcriptional regulator